MSFRKLKFENYKNFLEATQHDNKIKYPEKDEININSSFNYKIKRKEFIKNNKLKLKAQQRFKSETHNVFTKEINKITLSSNNDKIMHSTDLIETYIWNEQMEQAKI